MFRRTLLLLLLCAALAGASCGDPPDKEIQQAQGALDAAKAAGADRYAPEEFNGAQSALESANKAVADRDYRLALNHALQARERAQTAAKQAADEKAVVRGKAEKSITGAGAALDEARARLKAAQAARVRPKTLTDARRTVASADAAVQKARTAFVEGDYLTAFDATKNTVSELRQVARDLENAAAPGRRRH